MPDDKTPQPSDAPPVMQGGPGIDDAPAPAPAPPAPKLVTVKYLGREYQMDEEAAREWQEREKTLSRQGQELGEYRRRQTPQQEPPRQEPPKDDLETLWFENPRKAYERIQQETIDKVRGEYQRDQALRQFREGFYAKHPDLREDEDIVELVFSQHFAELGDLPVSRAQERLGELTRERMVKLLRKAPKPHSDTTRPRTLSEPASGERAPAARPQPDDGPQGISGVLRARRERQREAAAGARRGS